MDKCKWLVSLNDNIIMWEQFVFGSGQEKPVGRNDVYGEKASLPEVALN